MRFVKLILGLDNKKIFFMSFGLALILNFSLCVWGKNYSYAKQKSISDQVIRFHVLANSNNKLDQDLKLKVRDGILKNLEPQLKNSNNKSQTRLILKNNLTKIKNIAEKILLDNGSNYKTEVLLTHEYFPTRKYGDINFPAGDYDTLKIVIGNGHGHNWWCVMFPPLCFIDITKKTVPDDMKTKLKNILADEDFKLINCQSENTRFKLKFKVVEIWQNLNHLNRLAANSLGKSSLPNHK